MKELIALVEMLGECFTSFDLRMLFTFQKLPVGSVNWSQPLAFVCRDAVSVTLERGLLRQFLAAAVRERPHRQELADLVAALPSAARLRQNFNPHWPGLAFAHRCPAPAGQLIPADDLRRLVELLADCFTIFDLRRLFDFNRLPSAFVHWDQALFFVCRDAVRVTLERGLLGQFLAAAVDDLPARHDLADLVAELPAHGHPWHYPPSYWAGIDLKDPHAPRPGRRLPPAAARQLVEKLAECFAVIELDMLFSLQRLPHHFVNWNQPLLAVCRDAVRVTLACGLLRRFLDAAAYQRRNRSDLAQLVAELTPVIA